MNHLKTIQQEKGQLLIEVLVALLVGGIFLLGATLGVSSLLRYSFESRGNQVASSFAVEMLSDVESFTDTQWHNIYDLDKGIVNAHYLIPHPTSTIAIKGEESMLFVDVTAGRVGHWKFDELSGDTAYDSSGNFANATSTSFPTRLESSQCQAGKCLEFNGTSSFISAGNNTEITSLATGTIAFWFKTSNPAVQYVFGSGTAWGGIGIGNIGSTYNDESLAFLMHDGSAYKLEMYVRNGTSFYADGNWHQVVVVVDGVHNTIYIDGEEQEITYKAGSETTSGYFLNVGGQREITMGKRGYPGSPAFFDGILDDFRIYNRGLSAQEIKNLYEAALYTRYFYVDNVSRDISGNIVTSGGEDDPSTQKLTIGVDWEGGRNMTLTEYTTRNNPQNYMQTDWTGGGGVEGPVTSATSTYFNASNISTASYSLQLASTTVPGWLESTTFDTQREGGARLNNILWQGSKPSGTVVKFQLAYAATSTGPWSFVGDDGTAGSYFIPATSDIALQIKDIHNYRYFRYKVFLEPASSTSPIIDDIFINWTK